MESKISWLIYERKHLGPYSQMLRRLHTHIWQGIWRGLGHFQGYIYDPGDSLTLLLYLKREKTPMETWLNSILAFGNRWRETSENTDPRFPIYFGDNKNEIQK